MENDDADKESFEEKLEELNDIVEPIISAAGGAGGGGYDDDSDDSFDHDDL